MSETANSRPQPKSTRGGSGDEAILAQIEKWMAMIREISREQVKS